MKPLGLPAGLIAGAVGAAAWAAIGYFTNHEVGYVAWGIGLLVGVAVGKFGGGGTGAGIMAAGITVLALVAGKYGMIELMLRKELQEDPIDTSISDELLMCYVCDELIVERDSAGKPFEIPADFEIDEAETEADYPPEVWQAATEKWQAMSAEDQLAFRQAREAELADAADTILSSYREEAFKNSFSFFDLIFFGLGVYTAFGVAKSIDSPEEHAA